MPHQTATLHVTQLDDRVTESMLKEIFSMISPVNHVTIDTQHHSGLVEFHERPGAEQALHAMDGRIIMGQKIRIDWAKQVKQQHYYTLLINGLIQTITPDLLKKAFAAYSPRHVEVLVDPASTQPRYYGLIDFEHQQQAEQALLEMDGQTIGTSDPIQCTWANPQLLKSIATTGSAPENHDIHSPGTPILQISRPATPQTPSFSTAPLHPSTACRVTTNNMSYEDIFAQTPPFNTTVDVKNLPDEISEQDLIPHFQQYGYVSQITMADHGATIKLDTHANASTAIFALQGFDLGGRSIQLSWGTHEMDTGHPAMNYATPTSTLPAASLNNPASHPTGAVDVVQPQHPAYFDMLAHRPPAPVAGSPHSAGGKAGQAIHGWNQYYQTYYSAGHQNI